MSHLKEGGTYVGEASSVFYQQSAMVWTDLASIKYVFDIEEIEKNRKGIEKKHRKNIFNLIKLKFK